jgi:exonuclease SbcD
MRVVVCGDAHIGAIFGLGKPNGLGGNTRIDDYEKSLNHIIDYTIDSGADIFIQTGDIFEHRDPDVSYMTIVDRALKKLSNANISTFVIMGNHDYRRNGSTFTSSISSLAAADYPNVRMILNPEMIEVTKDNGERTNLLLLPFRDQRMYPGKTNKDKSAAFESQIKEMIDEAEEGVPIIAVGHNFFYEGSYNDFGGSELMLRPLVFEGCDVAMMGHLHQFRVLRKKAPVCIYTGSMERSNFGDANIDKYFIDYDITTKKASFKKVPSRDLLDITIDLKESTFSNIEENLREAVDAYDLNNKVVRFKIIVDEKIVPAVDKKAFSDLVYNAGAFFISKIIIEVISKRIVRDNEVLKHKDDASMFKAFLNSQELEDAFCKSLLKEAMIIMEAE